VPDGGQEERQARGGGGRVFHNKQAPILRPKEILEAPGRLETAIGKVGTVVVEANVTVVDGQA
jgi:hypothetical protein